MRSVFCVHLVEALVMSIPSRQEVARSKHTRA